MRGDPRCFDVTDPATGAVIRTVSDCGAEAARAAVDSADAAFAGWRQWTAADRAQLLRRWHAQIQAHAEDLARLICLEQGKSLHESRGEIAYGAAYVEWFAEEARRI